MKIKSNKITPKVLQELKKNGFMWLKDNTSDKVDPKLIEDVVPAVGGFTVIYKNCVLKMSTARVESIELSQSTDKWNVVNWETIADERENGTIVS